jgi:hypothetical protein
MAKTWQKHVKKVLKDQLRIWDNSAMIIAHPIAHPQVSLFLAARDISPCSPNLVKIRRAVRFKKATGAVC